MKNLRNSLVLLGLIVYCFAFQGVRGLYTSDEGRYTAVANEMIRSGDWLHPHLHFEHPHWTKPPLTYWAIGASIKLFGHKEYAARLPGALAFCVTIILVYLIGRVFLYCRPWVAPLIYGSCLFPFVASNIVSTDNLLTMWVSAAVFAFVKAEWGANKRMHTVWILMMWFFFAMAFMTKGPPGLLPLLAIGIYIWVTQRRDRYGKLAWFLGAALFLIVTIPWFAIVIHDYPELTSYFFKNEIIGRVSGQHHRNSHWYGAIIVYLPVLLLGTLPWTYWIIRDGYRGIKKLVQNGPGSLASLPDHTRFLLLWFVCPMVVFVIARSRLPLYILPLFVPISLLSARRLSKCSFLWTTQRIKLIGVWLVLLLLVRVAVAHIPSKHDSRSLAEAFRTIPYDTYDEVAFYEKQPINGLNFYLDKEMEEVDKNSLSDELHENERRLWVVETNKQSDLGNAIRQYSGRQLKQVGLLSSGYLILQE